MRLDLRGGLRGRLRGILTGRQETLRPILGAEGIDQQKKGGKEGIGHAYGRPEGGAGKPQCAVYAAQGDAVADGKQTADRQAGDHGRDGQPRSSEGDGQHGDRDLKVCVRKIEISVVNGRRQKQQRNEGEDQEQHECDEGEHPGHDVSGTEQRQLMAEL